MIWFFYFLRRIYRGLELDFSRTLKLGITIEMNTLQMYFELFCGIYVLDFWDLVVSHDEFHSKLIFFKISGPCWLAQNHKS